MLRELPELQLEYPIRLIPEKGTNSLIIFSTPDNNEALKAIADRGVDHLSLRELSTRIGVSHTAPYHHFADKTALIHALAHEGMAKMDAAMAEATQVAGADPIDRLTAIGLAFSERAISLV